MTVMHAWVDNETYLCPPGKNIPDLAVLKQTPADEPYYDESSPAFKRLLQVATLCNNAEFLTKNDDDSYMDLKAEMNNPNFNILKQAATGDASEQGVVKLVQPLNDALETRAACPKIFEINVFIVAGVLRNIERHHGLITPLSMISAEWFMGI